MFGWPVSHHQRFITTWSAATGDLGSIGDQLNYHDVLCNIAVLVW